METKTQCKCGAILKVKEELAGKRVKCPRCGDALRIPEPNAIHVTCACGRIIQAKASFLGKRVPCPACKQPLLIQSEVSSPGSQVLKQPAENKSPSRDNSRTPASAASSAPSHDALWNEIGNSLATAGKTQKVEKKPPRSEFSANQPMTGGTIASWDYVRLGITWNYIGMLLFAAAALSLLLALFLGIFYRSGLSLVALWMLAMFLSFCGSLLSTIGAVLCLTVPKRAKATVLIYISVGLDILAMLSTIGSMVPGLPNLRGTIPLINALGLVFFVLFLRQLASYIRSDEMVQRASEVLVLSILMILFGSLGFVTILTLGGVGAIFGLLCWLIVFFMFLLACFRYFQLLSGMNLSL